MSSIAIVELNHGLRITCHQMVKTVAPPVSVKKRPGMSIVMLTFISLVNILNLWIPATSADDTKTAPGQMTIAQLNWGVIFDKHSVTLNGESFFLHTIKISLKALNSPPVQIQHLACDTDQQKAFKCEKINDLIASVNSIASTRLTAAITRLRKVLNMVPHMNTPTPSTRGRRRRSAQKEFPTNTNCTAPLDKTLSLGHTTSCKIEAQTTRNHMASALLRKALRSHNNSTEARILRHKARRVRRGVFSSAGNFLSDMFNLPNKHDFEVLETHVKEIGNVVGAAKDELMQSEKELSSFQVKSSAALAQQMIAIKENSNQINTVRNSLAMAEAAHQKLADKETDAINIMETYLDYMMDITLKCTLFEAGVNTLEEEIDRYTRAVIALTQGYLSEVLVDPQDIGRILADITKHLSKDYVLTHTNPAFYYMMRSIVYTRQGDDLIIMLKIPVHNLGGLLSVYRITSLPVYQHQEGNGTTKIMNLPDFFAVDHNMDLYTEFSEAFYDTCRGHSVRTCSSQMSLQRTKYDDGSNSQGAIMSCAAALFFDNAPQVMKMCDISYQAEGNDLPSNPLMMRNGSYVITGGDAQSNEMWELNCPAASTGYSVRKIKSCVLCIIDVPCGCSIKSKTFVISRRLTNCEMPDDPNYPSVTYKYMYNLVSINENFARELANQFRADVVMVNKIPNIRYRPLNITRLNISDVVEARKVMDADMKKVIQAHKRRTKIYYSATDKLLAKAENLSDYTNSHVDDMESQIEHFTDNLDSTTVLGTVSVGMIIGIVSIILAVFVLIKVKI